MPISLHIDKIKDLSIFKATGVLSFDMAFPVVQTFYEGDPTRHVLWDLIGVTQIDFSSEEIATLVRFKPRYKGKRKLGKTAFVAQSDIHFGLARMFEIQSSIQDAPFPIMVFRSLSGAHQWLDES
jgi:hypothetical protein